MVIQPNGRVMAHTESGRVGAYLQDAVSRSLPPAPRTPAAGRRPQPDRYRAADSGQWPADRLGAGRHQPGGGHLRGLRVITRDGIVYTLLAILIGTLFAVFMARPDRRAVQKLVGVAEGIRGRRDLRAPEDRGDEIGRVSRNSI